MGFESILGITASIIAIGTLAFQGFQKFQKRDFSEMLTELADRSTTIRRQHRILRVMNITLKASGCSLTHSYIENFISGGRSKSAIFHDICIQNAIEPTKTFCIRCLGYDEPKFRIEWQNYQRRSSAQLDMKMDVVTIDSEYSNDNAVIQDWDTDYVYISDKLKIIYPQFHKRLCAKFNELEIPFGEIVGTKDIWCRDYMPIQVTSNRFIGYRYNPDYLTTNESAYPNMPQFAHLKCSDIITGQDEVWKTNGFRYNLISSDIILDGGNAVIAGKRVILTDKIYSENNCLSIKEKEVLLYKIESIFGLTPTILSWRPKDDDIYGHSDGVVKPLPMLSQKETIMISPLFKNEREQLYKDLNTLFDIKEILFDVRGKDFEKYAWAYINFLQVGNKILVPSLGLPCEESVMNQIRQYFPNCIVDSIEMREVVDEGGALHCITWNIKK